MWVYICICFVEYVSKFDSLLATRSFSEYDWMRGYFIIWCRVILFDIPLFYTYFLTRDYLLHSSWKHESSIFFKLKLTREVSSTRRMHWFGLKTKPNCDLHDFFRRVIHVYYWLLRLIDDYYYCIIWVCDHFCDCLLWPMLKLLCLIYIYPFRVVSVMGLMRFSFVRVWHWFYLQSIIRKNAKFVVFISKFYM